MHKIFNYLKLYHDECYSPRLYIPAALFLIAAFWFNYTFNFKRGILDPVATGWMRTPIYFAFYAVPYYGTAILGAFVLDERKLLRSKSFWAASAFLLIALAANRSLLLVPSMVAKEVHLPWELWTWFAKCGISLVRGLGLILTAVAFKLIWDRQRPDLYGLTWQGFDAKPYFMMLAIMVPLITWASFQPSFLAMYPIYRLGPAPEYLGWPPWATIGIHELCYAQRFIGVETIFRGVLVLGMVRWMGRATVLPMVVFYATWHFGKPLGEALGSIFGGYILGIIALYSQRIMGGVIVHMGVALLMNWAAYVQIYWLGR